MHGTVLPPLKKGWQATLDLRFHQAGGKTVLASAQHVGPLTVQRPFYPEEETCHLYLLHPPGGIVGGDELTISAHLAPGCHTLITMPGASKFYRSSGALAREIKYNSTRGVNPLSLAEVTLQSIKAEQLAADKIKVTLEFKDNASGRSKKFTEVYVLANGSFL